MKIICVGRNYAEHARELQNEVPDKPVIFIKPQTALLQNKKPFFYPDFSKEVHYEGEIVLKIGKVGKSVQPKFAVGYIEAVTIGFDFTARDLQNELKKKGLPWELAKGFDGAAAIGQFVKVDKKDFTGLKFTIKKNGFVVQEGNTADLIFSFEYLISFVSQYFMLQQGDMIFTGTPAGVGPVQIGDVLEGYLGDKLLITCPVK